MSKKEMAKEIADLRKRIVQLELRVEQASLNRVAEHNSKISGPMNMAGQPIPLDVFRIF